jgi:hypothetical protein
MPLLTLNNLPDKSSDEHEATAARCRGRPADLALLGVGNHDRTHALHRRLRPIPVLSAYSERGATLKLPFAVRDG